MTLSPSGHRHTQEATIDTKNSVESKKRQIVKNVLSEQLATTFVPQAPPDADSDVTSMRLGIKAGARRTCFGKISVGESLRRINAVAANKRNMELVSQYEQNIAKSKESTVAASIESSFVTQKTPGDVNSTSCSTRQSDFVLPTSITPTPPPSNERNTTSFFTANKLDLLTAYITASPPVSPSSASRSTKKVKGISLNNNSATTNDNIEEAAASNGSRSMSPASTGQTFIDLTIFDDPISLYATKDPAFVDLSLPSDDIPNANSYQDNSIDMMPIIAEEEAVAQSLVSSPPSTSITVIPTTILSIRPETMLSQRQQRVKPLASNSPRVFIESLATAKNNNKKSTPSVKIVIESHSPQPSRKRSSLAEQPPPLEYIPEQSTSEEFSAAEAVISDSENQGLELSTTTTFTSLLLQYHKHKVPSRHRQKRQAVSTAAPGASVQRKKKFPPLLPKDDDAPESIVNISKDTTTSFQERKATKQEEYKNNDDHYQLQSPPAPDYQLIFSLGSVLNYSLPPNSASYIEEYNRRLRANKLAAEKRIQQLMSMSPDEMAAANLKEQEEITALKRQLNII